MTFPDNSEKTWTHMAQVDWYAMAIADATDLEPGTSPEEADRQWVDRHNAGVTEWASRPHQGPEVEYF